MKTRAAAVTLALGALAYIALGVNRGFSIYDEGIPVVVAATRILDGDRPYRDFWVIYPPGQLYLVAAFFKVFGSPSRSTWPTCATASASIFRAPFLPLALPCFSSEGARSRPRCFTARNDR